MQHSYKIGSDVDVRRRGLERRRRRWREKRMTGVPYGFPEMGNICKKQIVSRGKVTNRARDGRGRRAGVSVSRPAGACLHRLMMAGQGGITDLHRCVMRKIATNVEWKWLLRSTWKGNKKNWHRKRKRQVFDCQDMCIRACHISIYSVDTLSMQRSTAFWKRKECLLNANVKSFIKL